MLASHGPSLSPHLVTGHARPTCMHVQPTFARMPALQSRGFKRAVPGKGEQLTVLAVEVHADSRGALLPDPNHDAVRWVRVSVWTCVEAYVHPCMATWGR